MGNGAIIKRVHSRNGDRRDDHLRHRYGITRVQFDQAAKAQECRCAICGEERPLVVDHDHATGEVRPLLCNGCNLARESRLRATKKYGSPFAHIEYRADRDRWGFRFTRDGKTFKVYRWATPEEAHKAFSALGL
jgi:hypothetical protein